MTAAGETKRPLAFAFGPPCWTVFGGELKRLASLRRRSPNATSKKGCALMTIR